MVTPHDEYDYLILGGGKAGKTLAMDAVRAGHSTAVIERGLIGGSCINIACIPSKTLIRSASVAHLTRLAGAYGTRAEDLGTDLRAVAQRTRSVVDGMIEMNRKQFDASGFELVLGDGRFVAPKTIEVRLAEGGTRRLRGTRVFINTGTHAAIPEAPGMADAQPLTHVGALALDRLPERLIVLGGGYVGLELAQAFRHLGARVSVIERGGQVASREDPDVAGEILALLRDDGIDVLLETTLVAVEGRSGDEVRVRVRSPEGESRIAGSDLLVAAGRVPNSADIGLEAAGVAVTANGYVQVNERLETTAPEVWALGEIAGSSQFTHVSLDDFRIVKTNLAGGNRTTRDRLVPYCMFIEPELARVGLSEREASKLGITARVAKLPLSSVPRARTLSETRGFMKALVDGTTDRILGFAMLGPNAGDVASVVQTAMVGKLPFTSLRDGILIHPTLSEGLNLLFANVH